MNSTSAGRGGLVFRKATPFLVGLVVAVAVGVVAAVVPAFVTAAILVGSGAFAALILARRYITARATESVSGLALRGSREDESVSAVEAFVPARFFYFAGIATIGQATIRPLLGLTLSDWLFFAGLCAALAAIMMTSRGVSVRIPALAVLGICVFVVSGLVSSIGADAPATSALYVARFAYLTLAWFWLGTVVLTRHRHLQIVLGLWVLSIALDGAAAVLQAKGLQVPFLGPVMSGRMTGFTDHPNNLGGPAAVALAPAVALLLLATRATARLIWLVVGLFVVAALVLSGSVSGMLAAAAAVGVLLVLQARGYKPLLIAVVIVAVAVGFSQLQGSQGLPTPTERLRSATGQSDEGRNDTVATRLQGYESVWDGVAHGGIVGHGLDSVESSPKIREQPTTCFSKRGMKPDGVPQSGFSSWS